MPMSADAFGPAAVSQAERIGPKQGEGVLTSSRRNGPFGAAYVAVIGRVDDGQIRLELALLLGTQFFDLRN
jgi:hypothetical protein